MRRASKQLGGWPLPNSRCPLSCSHRGTCLRPFRDRSAEAMERFELGKAAGAQPADDAVATSSSDVPEGSAPTRKPACICHHGYSGAGCEVANMARCFNGCSGHGACIARFCLCEKGWQGVDCSLRAAGEAPAVIAAPSEAEAAAGFAKRRAEGGVRYTQLDATKPAAGSAPPARRGKPYVPMYIYPLPTDFSLEGVYQRDQNRRGQYYANLMFMEQMYARRDSVVSDPEQAALFFVPVMVMQMAGNLWHPLEFLRTTVKKLSWEYPFWNRTGGTDHVFFLTTDRGGCWKPWALQDSLIISYLGFRASEGYFGFEERLMWPRQGPNNRNNAYSIRPGSEALDLDCYVEGKDVVVPVDAAIGATEEAKLPKWREPFQCKRGPHKVLLFMGGSMTNMGRAEYSQGVRQAIQRLHLNESCTRITANGVTGGGTGGSGEGCFVLGGRFTLDELRASRFCLCPSGWGWGWRLSLAIVTQCVPIIIQPNVTQPFEDLLEGTPYSYSSFSIRLTKEDIPSLPQKLRSIPMETICAMQQMLAKVYRAFLWQQPSGPTHASAYDLTQILLCRRAKSLAQKYLRGGQHPNAWLAKHGAGLDCADSLDAAGLGFE